MSRFVVDTPDDKGEVIPQKQAVVLEVRGGSRLRTADRVIVAQCKDEDIPVAPAANLSKVGSLIRCEVDSVDFTNRRLEGVVPIAVVASRSRVWADSWGRILFQHLHRTGQANSLSFEVLKRAAAGM